MVAITQQAAPDFSAQAASIAQARRLAAALSQAGANYDPTAQISGRTVPLNPLTAVINGLQQGYGAYKSAQADTQEQELESQKHAALIAALSGGQQPDIGSLAKSGLLGADDLVKMVVQKSQHQQQGNAGTPGQWFIPPGAVPYKDDVTGIVGYKTPEGAIIPSRAALTDYQALVTSPENRGQIADRVNGAKIFSVENPDKTKSYYRGSELVGDAVPQPASAQQAEIPTPTPQTNNNVGNIGPVGGGTGFQGYETPEAGLKAIDDNLKAYGEKHDINTLSGVISRWSPPNENNTQQLIDSASKRLGISPDQPIDLSDPVQRHVISGVIALQEKPVFKAGKPSYGMPLASEEALKANTDIAKAGQIEAMKTEEELKRKKQEAQLKTNTGADKTAAILNAPYDGKSIEEWIDQENGGAINAMANSAAGAFGAAPKSSIATQTLGTIEGWLTSNVPRMEGPQSDSDRLMYSKMAAQVGDPTVPAERKKAALKTLRALMEAYKGVSSGGESQPPKKHVDDIVKELLGGGQ